MVNPSQNCLTNVIYKGERDDSEYLTTHLQVLWNETVAEP